MRSRCALPWGFGLPVTILAVLQFLSRGVDAGWSTVAALESPTVNRTAANNSMPALIVAWSLSACATMMFALAMVEADDRGLLGLFGALLLALAAAIFWSVRSLSRSQTANANTRYAEM